MARRAKYRPVSAKVHRRKTGTAPPGERCPDHGREYTPEQLEWLRAVARLRQTRPGLTPCDPAVLELAKSLGYRKVAPPEPPPRRRGQRRPPARDKGADEVKPME